MTSIADHIAAIRQGAEEARAELMFGKQHGKDRQGNAICRLDEALQSLTALEAMLAPGDVAKQDITKREHERRLERFHRDNQSKGG